MSELDEPFPNTVFWKKIRVFVRTEVLAVWRSEVTRIGCVYTKSGKLL